MSKIRSDPVSDSSAGTRKFYRSKWLLFGTVKLLLVSLFVTVHELLFRPNDFSQVRAAIIRPQENGLLVQTQPDPDESPEATATAAPTEATVTATKPPYWCKSTEDCTRVFNTVSVFLPSGFTHQGGASVFGDLHYGPVALEPPAQMLPGTLFSLGIWPTSNQRDFQKPIEIRFTLDAAVVKPGTENQLTVRMYNPATQQWIAISSRFRPETYQLIASTASFTPVSDSFPDWGGRTFLGIFPADAAIRPTQATATRAAPVAPSGPIANRNSNLRAGPSTSFAIVGSAREGQSLELISRNAAGTWYQLQGGAWIAAFLVNNAPTLPVAQSLPTVAPTQAPLRTPTPLAEPEIREINMLRVTANQIIDLDNSLIGDLNAGDILYQTVGATERFLIPINGAQMAIVAASSPDYAICSQAEVTSALVDLNELSADVHLCVLTKEGRFAHLQLIPTEGDDPQALNILHTTWQATSVPRSRTATPTPSTARRPTATPIPRATASSTKAIAESESVVPDGLALLRVVNQFRREVRFTIDQQYRSESGPSEYDLQPEDVITLTVYPGRLTFSVSTPWRGLSGNAEVFVAKGTIQTLDLNFVPDPQQPEEWILKYE